ALKVRGNPEASELVQRLRLAQDHLQHLYEDVRLYAAPIKPIVQSADLRHAWRTAWAQLEAAWQGRDARLLEEGDAPPPCRTDSFRLEQVFRNILENALAACPDPVRVVVAWEPALLAGRPAVRVAVRDNGPGLNAEQRARIFEPYYTTKTKGTGL